MRRRTSKRNQAEKQAPGHKTTVAKRFRSKRVSARPCDRINAPSAEQIGKKIVGEKRFHRRCSHIKAARIGAERRHDHAQSIGNETAPTQASSPSRNGGAWVEVAGDFSSARTGLRFMPEHESADGDFFDCRAAEP
jgi:hypothetical protein